MRQPYTGTRPYRESKIVGGTSTLLTKALFASRELKLNLPHGEWVKMSASKPLARQKPTEQNLGNQGSTDSLEFFMIGTRAIFVKQATIGGVLETPMINSGYQRFY